MMRFLFCVLILCFILCGCENKKTNIGNNSIIIDNIAPDETEEDTANLIVTRNQNSSGVIVDDKIATKEKWPPDIFDSGKRTIEDIILPWTDDLVEEAWQMSYLSDNFTSYLDRCFCDFDCDGNPELFLTANNIFFSISVYKLNDGKIQYLGTIDFDGFIGRSVLTIPPTDPEIIKPENNKTDMWNFDTSSKNTRNFKILQDIENRCYFFGYGKSNNDRQCFVININIEDNQLTWHKVYQWGYFWGYDSDAETGSWFIYYIVYDKNGESTNTTKENIDNFIAGLNYS